MAYSMVIVYLNRLIIDGGSTVEWIRSNVAPANFQLVTSKKIFFTYKEDAAKFTIMFAGPGQSMIVCPVIEV